MADKKISISADLKVKVDEAERTIKRLQKIGIDTSKAMKGLDSKSDVGRNGLIKFLGTASKEMLKFRGTTNDTAKAMEYGYGRQIEKQSKALDLYTRKVERLNKIFKVHQTNQQFYSSIGNDEMANHAKSRMDKAVRHISVADAARTAIRQELNGPGGGGTSFADKANQVALLTQVIGNVMSRAGGMGQSYKTLQESNLATISGFHGSEINRVIGGDVASLGMVMNKKQKVRNQMKLDNIEFDLAKGGFTMPDNGTAKEFIDYVMNDDQKALNKASRNASGFGLLKDATGTKWPVMQRLGEAAVDTGKAVQGFGFGTGKGGVGGAGNNMSSAGNAYYSQQLSSASGGILAGIDFGANMNAGAPQAMEAASLTSQAQNLRAMRPYDMAVLQNLQATAGARLQASRRLGNKHMGLAWDGVGAGMDLGQSMSLGMGMAEQFGGAGGLGAARSGMKLSMGGFDATKAGGAVGMLNMSGANGQAEFAKLIGQGTKQGLEQVNIQFFEKLGQAVAGEAFGQGGASSGGNFTEALMFGLNGKSTMADVQGNVSGQQALSSFFTKNSFMQATGFELGKNILGENADGVDMTALNSASIRELMSDKNEELDALGIGKDQRKRMLEGKAEAAIRAHLGDDTEKGRYMLEGAEKAGGLQKFLAGDEKARAIMASTLKATSAGEFGDYKTAMGAVNVMAGINSPTAKEGAFGNMGDGAALAQLQNHAKVITTLISDEKVTEIVGWMNQTFEAFKGMKDIEPGFDAAQKAVKVLEDVFVALKKFEELEGLANKLNPPPPPPPEPGRNTFDPVGKKNPLGYNPPGAK